MSLLHLTDCLRAASPIMAVTEASPVGRPPSSGATDVDAVRLMPRCAGDIAAQPTSDGYRVRPVAAEHSSRYGDPITGLAVPGRTFPADVG
jgi:hypothetical protein